MSTPAAAVISAGASGAAPAGGTPGAPAGGTPAASSGAGAPAAANQAFYNDWFKPDAPDAKDTTTWLANKNFADPATLVKSYRGLETEAATLRSAANLKGYPVDKVNPDGTVVKADENARKAWNTTMGVPESPDKYDLGPMPEANASPEFKTFMQQVLHQAGVPAAMAPLLAKGYEGAVQKMMEKINADQNLKSEQGLLELQNAWGSNYQERIAYAQRGKEFMAKQVGGLTDLQLRTLESTLGTDKFITMMWKFGEGNKEASFAGGTGNPAGFGNSASQAQAELDQLTAQRTAGTVTQEQFRTRSAQLIEIITAGMAKPA